MKSDSESSRWAVRAWVVLVLAWVCAAAFAQTSDPPSVLIQPSSRTNNAGTDAQFTVSAAGTEPLSFQWFKADVPLADGGNLFGTLTATLTVSNVFSVDSGNYSVVITNDYGSITSAIANLEVVDPVITTQPVSQAVAPGQSVLLSAAAAGTPPLGYQWLKNGSPLDGATDLQLSVTNLQWADSASYRFTVSNALGTVTSVTAFVTVANPSVPDSFAPQLSNTVNSMVLQPDGKVVVSGSFTTIDGQPRRNLARFFADGRLDLSWNPMPSGGVFTMAIQRDGKIILGGYFSTLGGVSRRGLGRLNVDGSVDASFNLTSSNSPVTVYSLLLQPDGSFYVGGSFNALGGMALTGVARIGPSGEVDPSFKPGANNSVYSLVAQPDGKVLAGGDFTILAGQPCNRIGRLNVDGTFDTNFNASLGGANGRVLCLGLQADGAILAGGVFTTLAGQPCNRIGRLLSDGTPDTGFNSLLGGANSTVFSFCLQTDGQILIGGQFTTLGGQNNNRLGRLNTDGTADPSFAVSANGIVNSLVIQPDGAILVGGDFTSLGGQARSRIGRLTSTYPARQQLSYESGGITWERGGSSPEIAAATFEISSNFADWYLVGSGVRTSGGWQAPAQDLPANLYLRARGAYSGGYYNGSDSLLETVIGPLLITGQPQNLAVAPGQTGTFQVTAEGSGPISYQWRKDGVAIPGGTLDTLSLTNAQFSDAGRYDVVVTNLYNHLQSAVATLSVNTPLVADSWNPAGTLIIYPVVVQPDGKILVGGVFSSIASAPIANLARFNADGSLDSTFRPNPKGGIHCLAVQADYKILVGGAFSVVAGQPRTNLARLNPDGTLDLTFTNNANGEVDSLAIQADGKILVGGIFTSLGGQPRNRLGRVNPDGSLDPVFNPGATGAVDSFAVQPDGKILVAGAFTGLAGQTRNHIGRVDQDGNLDIDFNPNANDWVYCLALQADGRILASGPFTAIAGFWAAFLCRLNGDGSLDTTFMPSLGGQVGPLLVQADGKILAGGFHALTGGVTPSFLTRLNPDGTFDPSFAAGANQTVYALALQSDGKIVAGGAFSQIAGQRRNCLARLSNTSPASQNLRYDGSVLTWSRIGTCPEITTPTLDYTTNGTDWVNLGALSRCLQGWTLGSPALPSTCLVRGRGWILTDDSYSFTELFLPVGPQPPLTILVDDGSFGFRGPQFGFNLSGPLASQVVIEASPDLANWQAVGTNRFYSNSTYFSDPTATNIQQRFYRGRLQ